MGLDTVKFVMQVEKTFAITIPDHEAEKMLTVGDMHDYVMRVTVADGRALDSDQVWDQITEILTEDYGVPRAKITRDAGFIRDLGLD
jgi:acyl carrier protein